MTRVKRRPRPKTGTDENGGPPEFGIGVEAITPALAERMLRKNECNRPLSDSVVDRYVRDMRGAKWRQTGESLAIDTNGNLVNGQHRLTAVVRSGVTLRVPVARNVEPVAQEAMDSGKKRKFHDVLSMRGEKDSSHLAAIVNWCYQYEHDLLRVPVHPTNAEKLEWLDANPGVRGSLSWGRGVRRRVHVPISLVSGVYFEISKVHPVDVDEFFRQLISGANLTDTSPIFLLRRWLERVGIERDKPSHLVYAAFIIKAFNFWMRGEEIRNLRWTHAAAEPFPKITTVTREITNDDLEWR